MKAAVRRHVRSQPGQVATALARDVATRARAALEAGGSFSIVVPGGSTPRRLFALLCTLDTDWSRWHVFFTDERCLEPGHAERNDTLARSAWLDHVAVPDAQIHSIPAELGPDAGAAEHGRQLAGVGAFDVVVLGLGEDGHTASLFPGDTAGIAPDAPDVLAVHAAPNPPAERVTLSARRLADAASVAVLATGSAKRDAAAKLCRGDAIPAAAVVPRGGVDLWLDAESAPPASG